MGSYDDGTDLMTPEGALRLLDQAAAAVAASRADHVRLAEAVRVLQAAISEPKKDG